MTFLQSFKNSSLYEDVCGQTMFTRSKYGRKDCAAVWTLAWWCWRERAKEPEADMNCLCPLWLLQMTDRARFHQYANRDYRESPPALLISRNRLLSGNLVDISADFLPHSVTGRGWIPSSFHRVIEVLDGGSMSQDGRLHADRMLIGVLNRRECVRWDPPSSTASVTLHYWLTVSSHQISPNEHKRVDWGETIKLLLNVLILICTCIM